MLSLRSVTDVKPKTVFAWD